MSELLIEIFSEEIPARMQGKAAADLSRAVNQRLLDAGFMPEGVAAFAGPRRLTLVAGGLPAQTPDRREEKKGPRVGAPEKAVEGFLKSAGLASIDQCETREDKKGAYYVAVVEEAGGATADLVAGFMPEIIRGFSWPKSMRWGDGDLRWVRPIHSVLCVYDGEVVPFDIDGLMSGDATRGHRFMAPAEIRARGFEAYASELKKARVILDAEERKEIIARDAKTLCEASGFELVEDAGLLNEVAGLAEWPIAMMGVFDEKFLALPDEVLTASMRGHQKYFSVRDPKTGRLANRFVCVANIEAPDGGKAMRTGYERVLTARLSDAWYLYNQDLKTKLEDRLPALDKVTFFEGLGSIGDKARRVAVLAREIAPVVGADPELAEKAALLAKADLVSGMVYEFPELQGLMGRYYALEEGANGDVANAIRDHYKPAGQDDEIPAAPVSVAVALADKIDTLTAFWAIDKKPTGSSDPFALRRAALGVISLIETSTGRLPLVSQLHKRISGILELNITDDIRSEYQAVRNQIILSGDQKEQAIERQENIFASESFKAFLFELASQKSGDLLSFFHDRLKVYLRDKGHRHDQIDAVLADADGKLQDDLVLIVAKLKALEAFLKTDDGANLVAAYKRAGNILKAEEKKDKAPADASAVSESLLAEPEEKTFYAALLDAEGAATKAVAAEDFEGAMGALAKLRGALDAFFDKVTVNADDAKLRANRLSLLARLTAATAAVADFSKLEG